MNVKSSYRDLIQQRALLTLAFSSIVVCASDNANVWSDPGQKH